MNIFAYIDPGLGLLVWQTILAACIGTLFYLRKTRTWLVGLFKGKKSSEAEPGQTVGAARDRRS